MTGNRYVSSCVWHIHSEALASREGRLFDIYGVKNALFRKIVFGKFAKFGKILYLCQRKNVPKHVQLHENIHSTEIWHFAGYHSMYAMS